MAEYTSITLTVKAKSERALLLSDGDTEDWIPISQMYEVDPEYISKGEELNFEIKTWVLEEKGFV